MKNSEMIYGILQGLFKTAGRRTSESFAIAVIGAIIKTLEQRYDFLKHILLKNKIGSEEIIFIDSELNSIDPTFFARAIETIVQVVYMDLKEKAGFYFIKELKGNVGENVILSLMEAGIDLDLLQIQQHYLYRRKSHGGKDDETDPNKAPIDNVSLLGYSLDTVSEWEFDTAKKECIIYGKNGEVLDKLNLDDLVKKYIGDFSPSNKTDNDDIVKNKKRIIEITDQEAQLLEMMQKRDIDISTAILLLQISQSDLEHMIRRLLAIDFLHYVSSNEVALTEKGIDYLNKKAIIRVSNTI